MFLYWTPTSVLEHIFWTLVVKRVHSVQNLLQFMCSNSEHLFLECMFGFYEISYIRYISFRITGTNSIPKTSSNSHLSSSGFFYVGFSPGQVEVLKISPITYPLVIFSICQMYRWNHFNHVHTWPVTMNVIFDRPGYTVWLRKSGETTERR